MPQVEADRRKAAARGGELAAAAGSRWLLARAARAAWLRAGYALADHTRNALILSVFAFKVPLLRIVKLLTCDDGLALVCPYTLAFGSKGACGVHLPQCPPDYQTACYDCKL